MKQEVMRIWVDALRSGEYTQGVGCLKSTSGDHCCLGVLCELYDKNNEEKLIRVEWEDNKVSFNSSTMSLPDEVRTWAGMDYYDGSIPGLSTSLAVLNDDEVSFQEIADIIEQNVERL